MIHRPISSLLHSVPNYGKSEAGANVSTVQLLPMGRARVRVRVRVRVREREREREYFIFKLTKKEAMTISKPELLISHVKRRVTNNKYMCKIHLQVEF